MPYLESNSIKVFPATRRTIQPSLARQVTEANLVSLINKLIDKDGFVVTKLTGNEQTDLDFSFNIHGYYFTAALSLLKTIGQGTNNVYAKITIDTHSGVPEFYELLGQDVIPAGGSSYEYQGIEFKNSEFTLGANEYGLHLLTQDSDGHWVVPESSQVKFYLNSMQKLELIDGGVI